MDAKPRDPGSGKEQEQRKRQHRADQTPIQDTQTQLSPPGTTLTIATKDHLSEQIPNPPVFASLTQDSKPWAAASSWPSPGYVTLSYLPESGSRGSVVPSDFSSKQWGLDVPQDSHSGGFPLKRNGVWMQGSQKSTKTHLVRKPGGDDGIKKLKEMLPSSLKQS